MKKSKNWWLGVLALVLLPNVTLAIYYEDGNLDGPCAWASVVQVGSGCTGTLIGPGTVLTAAHCGNVADVEFGEHLAVPGQVIEAEADLFECASHYSYDVLDDTGVDIMVCRVSPMTPTPAVPIIPVMVPTGPARDWLHDEVYGPQGPREVVLVGLGHNAQTTSGHKLQGPAWLREQHFYEGTSTKLRSTAEVDGGPFAETRTGDSGGPMFVEMPDGSWMQIGVLHGGSTVANQHEAAPSWLHFIEQNASLGDDEFITPCHEYIDGQWAWVGGCQGAFPLNPGESYDTDWDQECAGATYGGGQYAHAGLTPPGPGDITAKPSPSSGGGWVAIQELEDTYATGLALAQSGGFGEVPTKSDIASWFVDQVEDTALETYLGEIKHAGIAGNYPANKLSGDFDGDSLPDTLYTDPYHDCGKGRIIVKLADGGASAWTRDTSGVLGAAACKDYFGAAVAVGDFDGDGYDDVVITAPGSLVSDKQQAGSISILYGSATGLTESGDQLLSQDSTGILDASELYDFFGEALAAADFNCDGFADVAVGAPRDDSGSIVDAGMAHIIYGSAGGLSTVDSTWFQGGGVNDTAESGDLFGAALAAGNFNGDSNPTNGQECMDLAIGAPGEDLGSPAIADAGFVYVAKGGTGGLTATSRFTRTCRRWSTSKRLATALERCWRRSMMAPTGVWSSRFLAKRV